MAGARMGHLNDTFLLVHFDITSVERKVPGYLSGFSGLISHHHLEDDSKGNKYEESVLTNSAYMEIASFNPQTRLAMQESGSWSPN